MDKVSATHKIIKLSSGAGKILRIDGTEGDFFIAKAKILYEGNGEGKTTSATRIMKIWSGYSFEAGNLFLYVGRDQRARNSAMADIIRVSKGGFFRVFTTEAEADEAIQSIDSWWTEGAKQASRYYSPIKKLLENNW